MTHWSVLDKIKIMPTDGFLLWTLYIQSITQNIKFVDTTWLAMGYNKKLYCKC